MKKFTVLFLLLCFLASCSNIDFNYKEDPLNKQLYNKTNIKITGDEVPFLNTIVLSKFGTSQNGSLECVIVCPTGIIGPYDYHSSYIGRTIGLYCSRKIPAYVSGGYDFVDVRDVATGTISASQNGNPGICCHFLKSEDILDSLICCNSSNEFHCKGLCVDLKR